MKILLQIMIVNNFKYTLTFEIKYKFSILLESCSFYTKIQYDLKKKTLQGQDHRWAVH